MEFEVKELRGENYHITVKEGTTISEFKSILAKHHERNSKDGIRVFSKSEILQDNVILSTQNYGNCLKYYIPPLKSTPFSPSKLVKKQDIQNLMSSSNEPLKDDNHPSQRRFLCSDFKNSPILENNEMNLSLHIPGTSIPEEECLFWNKKYPLLQNEYEQLQKIGFQNNDIFFLHWYLFAFHEFYQYSSPINNQTISDLLPEFQAFYPLNERSHQQIVCFRKILNFCYTALTNQ